MAKLISEIGTTKTTLAITDKLEGEDAAGNSFQTTTDAIAKLANGETVTNVTQAASPYSVTAAMSRSTRTNYGATALVEFDLPVGTDGLVYSFFRQANYAVRLDPNLSEIIGDGAAGKYLEIASRGLVTVAWINGQWEVTGGSATYTFEA